MPSITLSQTDFEANKSTPQNFYITVKDISAGLGSITTPESTFVYNGDVFSAPYRQPFVFGSTTLIASNTYRIATYIPAFTREGSFTIQVIDSSQNVLLAPIHIGTISAPLVTSTTNVNAYDTTVTLATTNPDGTLVPISSSPVVLSANTEIAQPVVVATNLDNAGNSLGDITLTADRTQLVASDVQGDVLKTVTLTPPQTLDGVYSELIPSAFEQSPASKLDVTTAEPIAQNNIAQLAQANAQSTHTAFPKIQLPDFLTRINPLIIGMVVLLIIIVVMSGNKGKAVIKA